MKRMFYSVINSLDFKTFILDLKWRSFQIKHEYIDGAN